MAYSPATHAVILANDGGTTWAWDGTTWTQVA
jgi:hypothetical protein